MYILQALRPHRQILEASFRSFRDKRQCYLPFRHCDSLRRLGDVEANAEVARVLQGDAAFALGWVLGRSLLVCGVGLILYEENVCLSIRETSVRHEQRTTHPELRQLGELSRHEPRQPIEVNLSGVNERKLYEIEYSLRQRTGTQLSLGR